MIIDAIKQYFAPLTVKSAVMFIVFLALLFAYAAEAAAEDLPIMHQQSKKSTDLFTEESHPDEYCIALNVYYESRADNLSGKYAVADVVLNRVEDPRYPNTVCGVVKQAIMKESWSTAQHKDLPDEERIYYPVRHKCQFSWFCDGKPDNPAQPESWREAQIIAYNIIHFARFRGITDGATHYHATYVNPSWSTAFDLKGQIGSHIFYQWARTGKYAKEPEIGTDGYGYTVPFEARILPNQ